MATSGESVLEPFYSPPSIILKNDQSYKKGFEKFWISKEHSDIDLLCGGESFEAHKILLASQSTFLDEQLSPTKNAGENIKSLNIEADPKLLKHCLEFVYSGMLEVAPSKLSALTSVAEKLQFSTLYNTCRAEAFKNVVPDKSNCLEIMCVGNSVGDESFIQNGKLLALDSLVELIDHPSFNKLCPECLMELVTDPNLKSSAPEQILSAVSSWIHRDLDKRQRYLLSFLEKISLKDIKHWNIQPYLMLPAFKKDADCQALLKAAVATFSSEAISSIKNGIVKGQTVESVKASLDNTKYINTNAVVIDLGSSTIRCGMGDHDAPTSVFPTVVGRTRKVKLFPSLQEKYVGDVAQERRGHLATSYPISRGVVQNWDDMEMILDYTFCEELKVDPQQHAVVITQALNDEEHQTKMSELIFEKYGVPSFFMVNSSCASLYSTGCVTGLVLDSGHGCTNIRPINEGYCIANAAQAFDVAGIDVTRFLEKMLRLTSSIEDDQAFVDIKEKCCHVAMNYYEESHKKKVYELPDGQSVSINKECCYSPESIFQPSLLGLNSPGIHGVVVSSINNCDPAIRQSLLSNIVLSGGNTLLPGFGKRLQAEVSSVVTKEEFKVIEQPWRKYSAWIGCSILSRLPSFPEICVNKRLYDEQGDSILRLKFH